MDSLSDLLAGKDFDEPQEITAIKRYVHDAYQSEVTVQLRDHDIVVLVESAALASQLRLNMQALQRAAETNKRITLRINN
jgi:hypothetical protein